MARCGNAGRGDVVYQKKERDGGKFQSDIVSSRTGNV